MSPKLTAQLVRLDRMTPRERLVVTICICALIWFALTALVISPAEREMATYGQLLVTQQEALTAATQELEGLRSGNVPPGDPDLREQLALIDKENVTADASLRASQQYLVPPETMGALLQDLLRRDKRLELVSLQTLPVSPVLDTSKQEASVAVAEPAAETPPSPVVATRNATPVVETAMFRHGVQMVVRGNFLNVLDYLQAVEKLPWQMYWGDFAMASTDAGQPIYSVSIYTLSLDKSWMKL